MTTSTNTTVIARSPSLLSNFAFQGAAQIGSYVVSLVLMALVLKTSGASTFGSFVVASSLLNLTTQFLTFGAGFSARRALPALDDSTSRAAAFVPVASVLFINHCGAALVLVLAWPLVNEFLLSGGEALNLGLVPLVVLSNYLVNLADDYFRYTHRIRLLSLAIVGRSIAHPILAAAWLFVEGRLSVNALFVCQVASYGLFGAGLWILIAEEIPLRFRLDTLRRHLDDLKYGFPVISAAIVENLLQVSDRYILAAYLSPAHAGAYAAACAIGAPLLIVPKLSTGVLIPAMSRAYDAGHPDEARAMVGNTLKVFLAIALPAIAGAAILAVPILLVIATPEVAQAGRNVLPIIAVVSVLYGWTYILFNTLFVQKNTRLWLRANSIAAVVSIGMNLTMLPLFPRLETAAVIALIAYSSSLVVIVWGVGRAGISTPGTGFILRAILATLSMSVVVWLGARIFESMSSPIAAVICLVPMGACLYAVSLMALGVTRPGDIRKVVSAVSWR